MSIGEQLKNQVLVRFADPEKEPVQEWLELNSARNAFDPGIMKYPALKIMAAENGVVHTYIPVHQPTMIESIGVNPQSTPLEVANAVMETIKVIASLTHQAGQREIWFAASDETTAKGAELMGFEPVNFKVYRRKL